MLVYFLRHGLAGDEKKWQGEDALRPLTEAGVQQVEQAAEGLAALHLHLDAILTSPMTRALTRHRSPPTVWCCKPC